MFKNLVRTAKKTQHLTVPKVNWLMLFKEITAVYSENHMKPTNTFRGQNTYFICKEGGTYNHHWALKA
jgi:hypothetical protein